MKKFTLNQQTKIGHVHLTVADLDRSLKFYCDILGFEVTTRYGDSAVFISAGGYHHHIGLNTWQGPGIKPQPRGYAGLYHFAILMPSRKALAQAVKNLVNHNYPIDGASDHGVSEAVYLTDPDGIGIELYRDRPKSSWPKDENGNLAMFTTTLDFDDLMAELTTA